MKLSAFSGQLSAKKKRQPRANVGRALPAKNLFFFASLREVS
jgi:hypothetical protein